MYDFCNKMNKCTICKHAYTSIHVEAMPGFILYVCQDCLNNAKDNFIWLCMNCGKVYVRPKSLVLKRLQNEELKSAYALCEDMQIIQGIDVCIECDPESIIEYVESARQAKYANA